MDIQLLKKKLPTKWSEIDLETFLKLQKIKINNDDTIGGIENTISQLSVFLDTSIEELQGLSMIELIELAQVISFTNELPNSNKTSIKWKKLEDITYDNWVSYNYYKEDILNHLDQFILDFSLNKYTKEDVLKLSIEEVYTGFFTLIHTLKRFTKRSKMRTIFQLVKLWIISKIKNIFKVNRK